MSSQLSCMWNMIAWYLTITYKHLGANWSRHEINGLGQERHNSIANALELRLSCTNPLRCDYWNLFMALKEDNMTSKLNGSKSERHFTVLMSHSFNVVNILGEMWSLSGMRNCKLLIRMHKIMPLGCSPYDVVTDQLGGADNGVGCEPSQYQDVILPV